MTCLNDRLTAPAGAAGALMTAFSASLHAADHHGVRDRRFISRGGKRWWRPTALQMTPAVPSNEFPVRWAGVLSAPEWTQGVRAIGEPRLDELHSLLAQGSLPFRASFIAHLADPAETFAAGRAVLLALARATYDASQRACAARHRHASSIEEGQR